MDSFEQLRKQAVERRDSAIAAARQEYRESLQRIKQLERTFGKRRERPAKLQPMSAIICRCLPRDRLFTINELLALLELAEPGRVFPPGSARTYFHILERQGAVRRVSRDGGQVWWAAKSYKVPETVYGAQNMRQVAVSVLRELGPRSVAEIVVTLQTRGYRPDADPRKLHEAVRTAMCKRLDLFRKDERGGRWSLV